MGVGIETLGGDDFFRLDMKTPCTKNSEYKSQAKKKKKKKKKQARLRIWNFQGF